MLLMGGARGGGKSDFLLFDILEQVHHPDFRGIIFRRSLKYLKPMMDKALKYWSQLYPDAVWNKTEKTWYFPSGAQIQFAYMKTEDDWRNYQGPEYQYVGLEEGTHFTKEQFDGLKGCCRCSVPGLRKYFRVTTNPGGVGHHWVKAYWKIGEVSPGEIWYDDQGLTRCFIPSTVNDCPQIMENDPDYIALLESLPDADRKAMLYGDWDAYSGSVFKLEPGIHVWTWEQFKERTGKDRPPKEWTRFRTMDWGYAKPFAVYWYAVDYDGRAYIYREWYGVEKNAKGEAQPNVGARIEPARVAEKIARIEGEAGEKIATAWTGPDLDHQTRGDHEGGKTIAEHFRDAKVYWQHWTATPGSRIAGKMALHERLKYERGEDGTILEYPGLIFIQEAAPHAIRTIPMLEYDEHQVEDVDSDGEDHAYDSIKGFCLMRPWKPIKRKEETADEYFERKRREKQSRGNGTWMSN